MNYDRPRPHRVAVRLSAHGDSAVAVRGVGGDPMSRMLDRYRWWHLYHHGHSIRVNRHITIGVTDRSKGWLFACECGKDWAR